MKPLSARERRLVAIGILIALIALAWLAAVKPVLDGFGIRADRRIELTAQYGQNERLIARIGALRRAAEESAKLRREFAIDAPSPEQASERLKERLEAALTKSGGELRATESAEAPAGWVRASASAVVTNDQLVKWLAILTREAPYLAMESLTISADRALNSNRLDLMDVQIEASIPFGPTGARPAPARPVPAR